nr:MAG TPA: hypothetical protein [Bacteriophage sp.]
MRASCNWYFNRPISSAISWILSMRSLVVSLSI